MKKIILLFIITLLTAFYVNAADIEVSHQLLTEEVYPGEVARINIIVKNNQVTDDYFKVAPDALGLYPLLSFSAFTDVMPASRNQVDINAGEEVTLPFDVYVRDDIEPDRRYTLNFNVRSGTDKEIKVKYPVPIQVISPEELVKITTDIPEEIMPGKEVVFSVTFRNQANMMVDPAELYVDSELFSKQYSEKLYPFPYEIKKSLKFTPEPTARAGTYELGIRVYKGKTLRGKLVKTFKVKPNPDVTSTVETTSGFLTRTIIVTKSNIGNVDLDETYTLPITWFQKMMTSFSEDPQKMMPGKVEWFLTLEPGETRTITINTDYRILVSVILAIFVATIITIYYIRRGVLIKKEIFKIKDERGSVSELKIIIHIFNRTSKPIRDIKVVDILPNILNLTKDFGTLKPNKVQKGEKSSRMIWNIDELEAGEERIISYKLRPGLKFFGRFVLPAALLRYRSMGHKIIDTKSNKLVFFSEGKKEKEE